MKKVIMALIVLVFNSLMFSCTTDSVREAGSLYDVQATEGDDSNPPPPPPGSD